MEHAISLSDLMVVLVEPSHTQHKIIGGYFQQVGVPDITWFENGQDALQEIHRVKPDLLISALYLPDMTGAELVKTIRADDELSELAFMLISSETHSEYLNPVKQAGAIAILPKPFELADLKHAMIATLNYVDPLNLDDLEVDLASARFLLVDDSQTSRHYIKKILSDMGAECFVEAENGKDAVRLMADQTFDLVVTDYNMPKMDGKELADYIRSDSNQATVPILMITSEQDGHRLSVVRQSGVSALCDKPFDIQNIRQLVMRLLQAV